MIVWLLLAIVLIETWLLVFYAIREWQDKPIKLMYDGNIRYGPKHERFYSHPQLYPNCMTGKSLDDKFIIKARSLPNNDNVTELARAYNGPNSNQFADNWALRSGALAQYSQIEIDFADGSRRVFEH